MATHKVKFEMSVEKLTFKFEGDVEHGQRIQLGITKALGDLSSLQNGAMGLPSSSPDAKVIDIPQLPSGGKSRRRKRRPQGENGAEGGDGDGISESGQESPRKSSGTSPMQLLLELRKENFFEGGKSANDIVAHLATKGHTKMTTSTFTAQLQQLCKKSVLMRTKNSEDVWVYTPGPQNE